MTDEHSPPSSPSAGPPSGEAPGGVDFAALVAQHNVARSGRDVPSASPGDGAPADVPVPSSRASSTGDGAVAPRSSTKVARSGRARWWRFGYPAVIGLVVVLVIPALVWSGLRVILDSSDGRLVKRVTDPTAPGYEAVITKTPTAVVAMVGPDSTLSGIAVLALTSDTSGGVLLLPPTIAYPTAYGAIPASHAWTADGIDGVATAAGLVLDLTFDEQIVIRASEWPSLLSTTGPLSVTLPDPVLGANDAVVIAKGTTKVKPEQIASLLDGKGSKESDLNRTLRQEIFWKAWLTQLRTSGAQFPGPVTEGLGRFVAVLARGQVSVDSLPVTPMPAQAPWPQRYQAVAEPAAAAVAAIVPFPEGTPGGRPRLRVLDGTGQLDNGLGAAIQLNAGGGQVDVVGNYKSFGQRTTQLIWFDGSSEAAALEMRDALGGIGEIVKSTATNSASDITVVLGQDYLQAYGPSSAPATTTGGTR